MIYQLVCLPGFSAAYFVSLEFQESMSPNSSFLKCQVCLTNEVLHGSFIQLATYSLLSGCSCVTSLMLLGFKSQKCVLYSTIDMQAKAMQRDRKRENK